MRLVRLAVTATAVIAAAAIVANSGPGARPPLPVSSLTVSAPESITAGESLEIEIVSDTGAEVIVVVSDSYTASRHELTMATTASRLTVPARHAGRVHVVAAAGGRTAHATTNVSAAPAAGAPAPLVGARSIVADGRDRAMAVVIPTDRFGNPVAPGTPITVRVVHPDGTGVDHRSEVERTLGWVWVPAVTTAGSADVAVVTNGDRGETRILLEVPGAPVPFDLDVETPYRPADGRTLVTVASSLLRDRFGNRMLDGTAAAVTAHYPDGTVATQTVTTTGGVARVTLEAPALPGTVRMEMTVRGTTGRPTDVSFGDDR